LKSSARSEKLELRKLGEETNKGIGRDE